MPNYTVEEAGFFYGTYYDKGAVITLLEAQAKYDVLHGSLVLQGAPAPQAQVSAPSLPEAISPPMPSAPKKPPRRLQSM